MLWYHCATPQALVLMSLTLRMPSNPLPRPGIPYFIPSHLGKKLSHSLSINTGTLCEQCSSHLSFNLLRWNLGSLTACVSSSSISSAPVSGKVAGRGQQQRSSCSVWRHTWEWWSTTWFEAGNAVCTDHIMCPKGKARCTAWWTSDIDSLVPND